MARQPTTIQKTVKSNPPRAIREAKNALLCMHRVLSGSGLFSKARCRYWMQQAAEERGEVEQGGHSPSQSRVFAPRASADGRRLRLLGDIVPGGFVSF
jgi:hypothetical protein